jgi:hypothetical protein
MVHLLNNFISASRDFLIAGVLAGSLSLASAQETTVAFSGKVVDGQGHGLSGARVDLLDSPLSATSDAEGGFTLSGKIPNGIIRLAGLPGGARLEITGGRLRLINPGLVLRVILVTSDGKVRTFDVAKGEGTGIGLDLETRMGRGLSAGMYLLSVESQAGSAKTTPGRATFRYLRGGSGNGVLLAGESASATRPKTLVAPKIAAAPDRFVLKVTASGYFDKSFALTQASDTGLTLTLLGAAATLKERIQDFLGAEKTFRIAFLKKDGAPSGKPALHYIDFAEMAGDTMPQHGYPDSRLDNQSVEAFAPSWSPDGRFIAYEAGFEGLTLPGSRVYIQPLQGARLDGPANTATNPRWFTDGKDTSLIWCTSGARRAWSDTAGSTYRQKFSGGRLTDTKERMAKGSFNAGLSPDARYLGTAIPWGAMLDLQVSELRYVHIYPGHAPGKPASDSLQVCNASVSRDPAHPSRLLFLDFGVPAGEAYANIVRPQQYAQHRMILIGDYLSEAPGRIIDYIDTPPAELAEGKTWDDPEWSNEADFAVATARDPNGDLSDPLSPRQTQPGIYLIKLSTRESLKVFNGPNQTLPAAWIGTP